MENDGLAKRLLGLSKKGGDKTDKKRKSRNGGGKGKFKEGPK